MAETVKRKTREGGRKKGERSIVFIQFELSEERREVEGVALVIIRGCFGFCAKRASLGKEEGGGTGQRM